MFSIYIVCIAKHTHMTVKKQINNYIKSKCAENHWSFICLFCICHRQSGTYNIIPILCVCMQPVTGEWSRHCAQTSGWIS